MFRRANVQRTCLKLFHDTEGFLENANERGFKELCQGCNIIIIQGSYDVISLVETQYIECSLTEFDTRYWLSYLCLNKMNML
jgi:hypothetical protein